MAQSRAAALARTLLATGAVLGIASAARPAQAQEQSGAPAESLETVIVTGTLIKRADFDTPSPLQVMTADDLKESGYTTISDVLRNLAANGQGTLTQTNPGAFAGGASGVALRGLTVGATLTLIDGERMVAYPLTDDGQRTFVDVSSIPFSVVDRVEVLKDGASSEYGSDAIAGVVNVILKKSFTGLEINGEAGETGKHDGATEHVNAIAGIGNLDSEGYNAYLSIEWRHQDEIYLDSRHGLWTITNWAPYGGLNLTPSIVENASGSAPLTFVTFPASLTGYLINPNTNALDDSTIFLHNACTLAKLLASQCTYIDKQFEIQPQTGNVNVLGRLTKSLGGEWQAIVTASLFRSEAEQVASHAVLSPVTVPNAEIEPGMTPTLVNASLFPITVPANYPGNTFGAPAPLVYNFPELGQVTDQYVTDIYRLFADLKGAWAGWDLDAEVGEMYAANTQRDSAGLNYVELQNALNNGYILGSADGTALFAPIEEVKDTNSLQDLDLRATRTLTALPGGPLSLGAGLGYYHHFLDASPLPTTASGAQFGPLAYAIGGQTNYAAYAELVAPVFKALELDGAVRWDHYNTYGSSTTPKFGVKYTPFRQLTFRGTFGQGFRAPNPAEAGNAASLFVSGAYPDPILCKQTATGQQLPGSFPSTCVETPTGLQTTSPNLKPEKSTNYTVGFIATPVEPLKLSLDYWDIKIKRDVVSAEELVDLGVPIQALQFTIIRGPRLPLTEVVNTPACLNSAPTYSACPTVETPVGEIDFQEFPYVNATQTEVNGIDLDLSSHLDIGKAGRLSASLNYTHLFHYYLTAPTGVTTDLAGTHGPTGVSGDTGNPKDRAVLSLSWDRGPWDVTGTVNYIGPFNLTDPSIGYDTCGAGVYFSTKWPTTTYTGPTSWCQVDHFVDVDLYAEYAFSDHLRVHGSVLNVFDKPPPLDLNTYGSSGNYDGAFHDAGAIGRFFNIGATYTF